VSVPFFWGGGEPQSVSTGWQALGLVRVKKPGAQTSCLSPHPGAKAGLDRPAGAWVGPAGQESGRPHMVKLRVCPLFPGGAVSPSRSQLAGKRLGLSGSKNRAPKHRVCPHIPATMRPFGHHHWTLRVERFTLNVPDRCIGHRVCPHIWNFVSVPTSGRQGRPRPPGRRLGSSGGSTVRSSRFRVCPHVLATMRPFGHHHWTLRVERFTLNVPDRHIGHRACPHIWNFVSVPTSGRQGRPRPPGRRLGSSGG